LEAENEALRTHLRLALETIRDPIPEILYLTPDDEEVDVTEGWGQEVFDQLEDWDDCWAVLGDEASLLASEVSNWRLAMEKDLRDWQSDTVNSIVVSA
jgi:hypothetical protein